MTGGEILATDAIRSAYHEGRGSLPVRGKVFVEGEPTEADGTATGAHANGSPAGKTGKGKGQKRRDTKPAVVITELPYQTNKVSPRALKRKRGRAKNSSILRDLAAQFCQCQAALACS